MIEPTPRTVLLVEDDADLRAVLADALRLLGVRVVTAADGHDALCLLDTFNVALVVMDFWMPRFNGRQILAYMRAVGLRAPVVMMSAHPTGVAQPDLIRADVYLRKPFDAARFAAVVQAVLADAPAAAVSGTYPTVAAADATVARGRRETG